MDGTKTNRIWVQSPLIQRIIMAIAFIIPPLLWVGMLTSFRMCSPAWWAGQ